MFDGYEWIWYVYIDEMEDNGMTWMGFGWLRMKR
jgi:hypothetical protein